MARGLRVTRAEPKGNGASGGPRAVDPPRASSASTARNLVGMGVNPLRVHWGRHAQDAWGLKGDVARIDIHGAGTPVTGSADGDEATITYGTVDEGTSAEVPDRYPIEDRNTSSIGPACFSYVLRDLARRRRSRQE